MGPWQCGGTHKRREQTSVDPFGIRQHDGAFERVAQLAHIAGPIVRGEQTQRIVLQFEMSPMAALAAVLLTDPAAVAPVFTGIFMGKMVGFVKLYFPVFLLDGLGRPSRIRNPIATFSRSRSSKRSRRSS